MVSRGTLARRIGYHKTLLPILAGGLIMVFALAHFGVNTPYWDQWSMVRLFQKVDSRTIGVHDLWAQHNEHRIPIPLAVLLVNAYATNWNTKAALFISFVFSMVTVLLLYLMTRFRFKSSAIALVWSVLLALWFFSPVQWENWLWGWQVEWFMCIAGIITALFLIDCLAYKPKHPRLLFGGAIVAAVIATFSLGSGVLVWPVGLGILVLQRQRIKMQHVKLVAMWCVFTIISIVAYYHHYHKPPTSPPVLTFIHQPVNFIRYICGFIGRPVTDDLGTSLFMGALLLCALIPVGYLVWRKRTNLEKFIPWLALIVLSLLATLMTAVSRVGFGYSQSMSSRYTAFSLLYIIGLSGLILVMADGAARQARSIPVTILALVAVSIPLLSSSYVNGAHGFSLRAAYLRHIASCTAQPNPPNHCLSETYPYIQKIPGMLNYLKAKHWGGY